MSTISARITATLNRLSEQQLTDLDRLATLVTQTGSVEAASRKLLSENQDTLIVSRQRMAAFSSKMDIQAGNAPSDGDIYQAVANDTVNALALLETFSPNFQAGE